MSGFRVREREMGVLGMKLPGLAKRAGAVGALPALGLLTLAGMTPTAWDVSYHEAAQVDDAIVQAIVSERPTLVGISALTASIIEAYALAARLRGEGVRVVLGGLHVTVCPDEAARHADAIVVGDGEAAWPQVLRDAESGRLKPMYRVERPFDLAAAPLPRFELLGTKVRPRYTVQTARGCPLACEFCGASRLLGPFREKPAALVAEELRTIAHLDPRAMVELADDNSFAGRREPAALFEAFAGSGVRYFTEADWRIGERPEVLDGLAASGCVQVLVGVESVTHEFAGLGAKRAPLARVVDALERVQDSGVAVIACFVVGADSDDVESINQLAEWLLDAPFADVQLTMQTPFPGTALHRKLAAAGRLLPERGWESYTLFDATYRPARMEVLEFERAFRNAVRMVFSEEPSRRRDEIRRKVWGNRYKVAS